MKNRWISILLALVLTVGLTACTTDRGEERSSSSETEQESVSVSSSEPEPESEPEEQEWESGDPYPYAEPAMGSNFPVVAQLSGEAVTWGPATNMDEENRPIACLQLQKQYGDYNVNFIGPDEKRIYLTFDEGYENGNTADILDILKEKNVKAVFFVTGHYCKTNPELVQRMIDEGHIVGNHSMNHPNFTTITPEEMYEEVKELHDYVQENFDYTMFLFRYPEGVFSEQSLAVLQDAGYQTSFWSYAYNDWDQNNQPDPDTAYQKVTGALHPGAIYLLHAVSETNSEILGDFIDEARSQGYEVSVYNIPPVENPREGASASSQTESSSESQTESQSESGTEAE